jgi:hypothetical protein
LHDRRSPAPVASLPEGRACQRPPDRSAASTRCMCSAPDVCVRVLTVEISPPTPAESWSRKSIARRMSKRSEHQHYTQPLTVTIIRRARLKRALRREDEQCWSHCRRAGSGVVVRPVGRWRSPIRLSLRICSSGWWIPRHVGIPSGPFCGHLFGRRRAAAASRPAARRGRAIAPRALRPRQAITLSIAMGEAAHARVGRDRARSAPSRSASTSNARTFWASL